MKAPDLIDECFEFKQTRKGGNTVIIRNHAVDMNFAELLSMFSDFAIACGFAESTIKDYLKD